MKTGRAMRKKKKELILLIPGFYADNSGSVYLNMREFLLQHGLPDSADARKVVWEEVRAIFDEVEVREITD
ncbi:MAG: hypothetical protein ACHP79_04350 [Terriglobales bacterium]